MSEQSDRELRQKKRDNTKDGSTHDSSSGLLTEQRFVVPVVLANKFHDPLHRRNVEAICPGFGPRSDEDIRVFDRDLVLESFFSPRQTLDGVKRVRVLVSTDFSFI